MEKSVYQTGVFSCLIKQKNYLPDFLPVRGNLVNFGNKKEKEESLLIFFRKWNLKEIGLGRKINVYESSGTDENCSVYVSDFYGGMIYEKKITHFIGTLYSKVFRG